MLRSELKSSRSLILKSEKMSFIHLRVHSAYSLAEGAVTVKDLVKICQKQNMPAVAVTDSCNVFGALEFSVTAAGSGIQPIVGAVIPMMREDRDPLSALLPPPDSLVLLVQNERGYKNLMSLVSEAYLKTPAGCVPQLSWESLKGRSDGLICLTAGPKGIVSRHILENRLSMAKKSLQTLQELFPDRLYVELMRHGLKEEEDTEESLINLAYDLNIPLVATNDVFFATEDLHEAHDALLCIAEGAYVSATNRRTLTPHHYFKSAQEMKDLFADLPEAIENTVHIARRCYYRPLPHKPILPNFPTDSGRTEQEELRYKTETGLMERLEHQVYLPDDDDATREEKKKRYFDRLNYEIGIIEKMGFPGYFLIVSDFIQWAKSQGIPVGPGRGSGAGSLAAWALTITDIDPIRFTLIFERFLNPERVSMPDFDVDFCQDRRDEVIDYVRRKYGDDRVAQIITFGKLQARMVLRDVGRVLQMSYSQVDRICNLIPNNPANPTSLEQALVLEPALEETRRTDESVQKLIDIGLKLEGLYRHASTHAAGVVIGDRPIPELVALYKDDRSALPATQFSMKYVEMAGLVKFDFLGLKTLTVIQKCCQLAKERGFDVDISKIPLDDDKTFELLCRVETVGVFQVESAGMREVVKKMQPDRFEDLIALVALYRPGPMDDIPRYIACKNGEEEVTYLHPELEPILKETYGVMVYQEQVMQIAQVLGGYTLGAADLLRRAMGKKIKSEMDAQQALFVQGAVEKGVQEDIAIQIFELMAKFAGYGFNKSHSAPYALLTYQTAYLKAHYPLEFYAASMTYDLQNTDKLNIFRQDLLKLGHKFYGPDINLSNPYFKVESDGIRHALAAVKNVGELGMTSVVAERAKSGLFKDVTDFANRIDPKVLNKRQVENLIAAGAFDCLHSKRGELYANAEEILRTANVRHQEKQSVQISLFDRSGTAQEKVHIVKGHDWNPLDKLQKEFEALGFFLSAHPLDVYGDNLSKLGITPSSSLGTSFENGSLKLAGVLVVKQERTSKAGQKFAFLQLSDAFGVYEVAVFSEVFAKCRDILTPGVAFFIQAMIRWTDDEYRLTAQSIEVLDKITENLSSQARILVTDHLEVPHFVSTLRSLPKGTTRIIIDVILDVNKKKIGGGEKPARHVVLAGFDGAMLNSESRSQILGVPGVIRIEDN